MKRWEDERDDRDYSEPGWWRSLTPRGQTAVAILALVIFTLLMIAVGTIEFM